MAILEMRNICKSFAGTYANENVSISVEKGEIHALLGENGAGKTTLMNILFGIYTADSGDIYWKGEKRSFSSPKEAIESGIGMVHQHFSLVKKMTVLDNMILGMAENGFVLDRKALKDKMQQLGEKYGLSVKPDAFVSELSVGEQQRVEILKALYRDVQLLILDEPTGVLTPQETEHFFKVLKSLKAEGYAIIIITHRMSEIMAISDRVTILRDGKCVKELTTVMTNPEELSHYMIGRELKDHYEIRENQGGKPALVLENVTLQKRSHKPLLDSISLEIREGEILGVAGVDGNGQKELAEVITGIRHLSAGRIMLHGSDMSHDSIRARHQKGVAYISDDRLHDGLVPDMDIAENLILREYKKKPFASHSWMNKKAIDEHAENKQKEYQIKASGKNSIRTIVRLMSGGNQQKIIAARELTDHAKLVIANQPTRGLDIGATEFVREQLMAQRNAGKSVLLISADLEEILGLSDRIAVMFDGKIVGIMDRKDATVNRIGLWMGGVTEVRS